MRGAQCAVVIPSCRTVTAERLSQIPEGTAVYVVSDTDAPIPVVRPGMQVFDLAFQRKVMGADYDLIPRRTSACRNFGFFYIWKHTDHEYVVSIDDDVEPAGGFLDHFAHLGDTRALETAGGVGSNYFSMLGVPPGLGRVLQPGEAREPGRDPIVILGSSYWKKRFNADPSIVGRSVIVNGKPFIVAGVVPAWFEGVYALVEFDAYMPLSMRPPDDYTRVTTKRTRCM